MDWTDITIDKFNQIKDFILDPENTEEDRVLYEIQILTGKDPLKMPLPELRENIKNLEFLGKRIPNMKVQKKYRLGETTYTLSKKIQNLTVAQWLDFQHYIKEGGSTTENYPNILSVFLIPEGIKEYNEGYDIDDVKEDIATKMSVADGMAVANFFSLWQRAFMTSFLSFTRRKTMEAPLPWKKRRMVRREFKKAMREASGV